MIEKVRLKDVIERPEIAKKLESYPVAILSGTRSLRFLDKHIANAALLEVHLQLLEIIDNIDMYDNLESEDLSDMAMFFATKYCLSKKTK